MVSVSVPHARARCQPRGRSLRPEADRLQQQQEVVRVIPVSTGKASTPTPIFDGKVYTKYRSTTMRGRTYVVHGVPTPCVSAPMRPSASMAPWQENAGQAFGVPRSNGCVRMPMTRTLAVPEHHPPARRSRSRPDQRTGRSPGWPVTGSSGTASSGPTAPASAGADSIAPTRPATS